ncbi:hypothetical protein ONJ95_26755, partial [Salmonella enterica subsp. enterica serovar Virginia]|nr:hypothetical protein [Salmonella enterica subsp. enterica serovar Virginia]
HTQFNAALPWDSMDMDFMNLNQTAHGGREFGFIGARMRQQHAKKAFEADCNCELKLVALEDGVSLLNRLRMEGKNSKADVVLGL